MGLVNVCGTGFDPIIVGKNSLAGGTDSKLDTGPGDCGYPLARNISPVALDADEGDNVLGSRGGIQVPYGTSDHNNNSEVFTVRTENIITYGIWIHETVVPTFLFSLYAAGFLRSTYEPYTSATDGAVGLVKVPITATTFRIDLYGRSGGAWDLLGGGTGPSTIAEGSHICVMLQVDLDNGGGTKRARVLLGTGVGGSYSVATYIDWVESIVIDGAGVFGTPSVGGAQIGAAGNGITGKISDCFKGENDTEAVIDFPDETHCCHLYPRAVGSNGMGNWAEGGDASCDGNPMRQIADPEHDGDQANDYITTPSATQTDWYGTLAGEVDASADIYGVGADSVIGDGSLPSHFHVKDNGNTLRVAINGAGATDQLGYVTFPTQADGSSAWTPAALNSHEFGARASASDARLYAYSVWVVGHNVFGTDVYRESKLADCAAAATGFVPKVMVS
jgi:hypothetical protein